MNQPCETLVEVIHKNGIATYEGYDSTGRFVAYFGVYKPDNIDVTMTIDRRVAIRVIDTIHRR